LAQDWHDYVLIRHRERGDAAGMATLAKKIESEKRMREFLDEHGLPQPDFVEYGFTCIRLFYNSSKTVVVVDIDAPEGAEPSPDAPEGAEPSPDAGAV